MSLIEPIFVLSSCAQAFSDVRCIRMCSSICFGMCAAYAVLKLNCFGLTSNVFDRAEDWEEKTQQQRRKAKRSTKAPVVGLQKTFQVKCTDLHPMLSTLFSGFIVSIVFVKGVLKEVRVDV